MFLKHLWQQYLLISQDAAGAAQPRTGFPGQHDIETFVTSHNPPLRSKAAMLQAVRLCPLPQIQGTHILHPGFLKIWGSFTCSSARMPLGQLRPAQPSRASIQDSACSW